MHHVGLKIMAYTSARYCIFCFVWVAALKRHIIQFFFINLRFRPFRDKSLLCVQSSVLKIQIQRVRCYVMAINLNQNCTRRKNSSGNKLPCMVWSNLENVAQMTSKLRPWLSLHYLAVGVLFWLTPHLQSEERESSKTCQLGTLAQPMLQTSKN